MQAATDPLASRLLQDIMMEMETGLDRAATSRRTRRLAS
jgi:hypothetical protein